jgi:uncharacterized membrane protein YphA (DoxX/SURF4 family)
MFADEEKRLIAITRVVAISVLCCLAFSWRLWISRPYYPLVPVLDFLRPLPHPYDWLALGGLAGLLVATAFRPRSRLVLSLLLTEFVLLFLQDQSRLWPSFYQFFFMLLQLLSYRAALGACDAPRVLAGMRLILAAVYFWGGVQKLNPHFFHEEFPWFVEPITHRLPFDVPMLPALGLLAALFEVAIGIGLLTRRFRRIAMYEALLMHGVIFFCIGPLRDDWNNSAWMWSLTVAVQVWVLFHRAPAFEFRILFDAPRWAAAPQLLAVLLIGMMPVLNNFNRWDSALSFNVYTGNVSYAEIHLHPDAVAQLPSALQEFVSREGDEAVLHLNRWALSEFNANPYPELRVFEAVFRKVCTYVPSGAAVLYVREKAGWFFPKSLHRFDCENLSDSWSE